MPGNTQGVCEHRQLQGSPPALLSSGFFQSPLVIGDPPRLAMRAVRAGPCLRCLCVTSSSHGDLSTVYAGAAARSSSKPALLQWDLHVVSNVGSQLCPRSEIRGRAQPSLGSSPPWEAESIHLRIPPPSPRVPRACPGGAASTCSGKPVFPGRPQIQNPAFWEDFRAPVLCWWSSSLRCLWLGAPWPHPVTSGSCCHLFICSQTPTAPWNDCRRSQHRDKLWSLFTQMECQCWGIWGGALTGGG